MYEQTQALVNMYSVIFCSCLRANIQDRFCRLSSQTWFHKSQFHFLARHSLQCSRNFLFSSRLCVGGASPFSCVNIENGTVFREVECNLLSEKAMKILPKFFSSEGINYRVDTTVDHWDCFCNLGCFMQLTTAFTSSDGKCTLKITQENANVVRCPEKKVDNHDDKNKPDCFMFLLIPTLQ